MLITKLLTQLLLLTLKLSTKITPRLPLSIPRSGIITLFNNLTAKPPLKLKDYETVTEILYFCIYELLNPSETISVILYMSVFFLYVGLDPGFYFHIINGLACYYNWKTLKKSSQ